MASGLTKPEIVRIVNRYIGVTGGYLGDFSYRTHADFYPEYCDLDIDPYELAGTTRERFIHILSSANPRDQAAIVEGVLSRFPAGSEPQRTPDLAEQLRSLAARCRNEGHVASPSLPETQFSVREALADAETLLEQRGAISGLDRIHTAFHGYLRGVCSDAGVVVDESMTIATLFKLIREQHPKFDTNGPHGDQIKKTLRSLGAAVDALGPARNRGSLAHPNEDLLGPVEAMLFINTMRTLLHYVSAKLGADDRSDLSETQDSR